MNVLRIECETCNAVLRVRDEGFVGEVHACPRCGSMVMITGATGAAPAAEAPSASPAPPDATPSMTLGLGSTLEATEDAPASEAPPAPVADQPDVAPIDEPAAASWVFPIATTSVSLLATGAILAVWFVSGPAESPPAVATADPPPATVATESVAETREVVTPIDQPAAAESDIPPADDANPAAPVVEDNAPKVEPPAPPVERVASLPADPPPWTGFDEPDDAMASTEPVSEIDPLDFDPAEAELVLRRDGAPANPPTAAPAIVAFDPPKDEGPSLDQRLAAAARDAGISVRRAPTDAKSAPTVEPAEVALARVLPAVDLREMPLDEAVRLLGEIAGAPITLEPTALVRAGVAASRPVDVVGERQTLGALLRSTLGSVRLEPQVDGPHVRVVRQKVATEREFTHRLDDLAGGELTELVELLDRLLPQLTAADRVVAADGLTLTAPRALHFDVMILAERLRVARSLPTTTRYPTSRLATTPALAGLAPVLDRRTTFTFIDPTPLTEVVAHWRRVTKLSILVDWRSLADVGLGRRSRVECSVVNRPWSAALDGVLGPLGLAWAPIDDRTILLASADTIADRSAIDFYPVAPRDAETLAARIASDHPEAEAVYDRSARSLLVRGDAATHRRVWSLVAADSAP